MTAKRPLERDVQRSIVTLFKSCGGHIWETSQGYRKDPGGTRMTPGLSDLIVAFPRYRRVLFFEVKRPGGKRSAAQVLFANVVTMCDASYGLGGFEDAKALMQSWGAIP